jgi:hypothetical protein
MGNWNQVTLTELNNILADLYPSETDAKRIAANAGLNTKQIDFSGNSVNRWFTVLEYARPRGRVDALVAEVLKENSVPELIALVRKCAADAAPAVDLTDNKAEVQKRDSIREFARKNQNWLFTCLLILAPVAGLLVRLVDRTEWIYWLIPGSAVMAVAVFQLGSLWKYSQALTSIPTAGNVGLRRKKTSYAMVLLALLSISISAFVLNLLDH